MTVFFAFEELTWPEVADLPRDTPLVIPLEFNYSRDLLVQSLNNPKSVGLLPSIPFGWRGSGLEVSERLLNNFVLNLLNSLVDDGFTQVYVLTPQEICIDLGSHRLVQYDPTRLAPSSLIPSDTEKDKVILIPIGHTEQHSHHLPLNTDTIIIQAVANGVQENNSELAFALPVMPYGVSTHRSSFAGTLNVGGRIFEDFWLDILDRLVHRGFSRFYLLSGHGGNCSFLTNIVKYAGERFYQSFIATSWLYLSGPKGIESLQKNRESKTGGMGHAGELETSLMLRLRPDLVHMDRVIDETSFLASDSYYMDWVEGGALIANPPWEDDVSYGAYGAGSLGTPEKGAVWLKDAIDEKMDHVYEIHQQYKMRIHRRSVFKPKSR